MEVCEVTSSKAISLTLSALLPRRPRDRNRGAIYSCPASGHVPFPGYAIGAKPELKTRPRRRRGALLPLPSLVKDILTLLDTNHPIAGPLDLHLTARLSPKTSLHDPSSCTVKSPAFGGSKGQLLLSRGDEGGAWIATRQTFYNRSFRSVAAVREG